MPTHFLYSRSFFFRFEGAPLFTAFHFTSSIPIPTPGYAPGIKRIFWTLFHFPTSLARWNVGTNFDAFRISSLLCFGPAQKVRMLPSPMNTPHPFCTSSYAVRFEGSLAPHTQQYLNIFSSATLFHLLINCTFLGVDYLV